MLARTPKRSPAAAVVQRQGVVVFASVPVHGLRSRLRPEEGQVLVLAAVGMTAICGMAGFVIDVGSWYQTHRKQQAIADASALAAASDLPANTSQATADAQSYAAKNGGSSPTIAYSSTYMANDTITVTSATTAPATFLKVLGINSAHVSASATVRAENLGAAWGAAPFAVINTQPELAGAGCPCLGVPTQLTLNKVGPGGFEVLNVDGSRGGTSQSTLAGWILNGCDCDITTPAWLYSDPGAKFNPSEVDNAMHDRLNDNLLFPVYDMTRGGGSNLQYRIIGFAGFVVTSYQFQGNNGWMDGSFVHVDWEGTGTPNTSTYFGATTSQIVG
jgi:Flp pilus assembly protein TadG